MGVELLNFGTCASEIRGRRAPRVAGATAAQCPAARACAYSARARTARAERRPACTTRRHQKS
eukprot:6179017-Pleurochrysis_carterae.AAC.1